MRFTCPRCGKGSNSHGDARHGWCGICRDVTGNDPVRYLRLRGFGLPERAGTTVLAVFDTKTWYYLPMRAAVVDDGLAGRAWDLLTGQISSDPCLRCWKGGHRGEDCPLASARLNEVTAVMGEQFAGPGRDQFLAALNDTRTPQRCRELGADFRADSAR